MVRYSFPHLFDAGAVESPMETIPVRQVELVLVDANKEKTQRYR